MFSAGPFFNLWVCHVWTWLWGFYLLYIHSLSLHLKAHWMITVYIIYNLNAFIKKNMLSTPGFRSHLYSVFVMSGLLKGIKPGRVSKLKEPIKFVSLSVRALHWKTVHMTPSSGQIKTLHKFWRYLSWAAPVCFLGKRKKKTVGLFHISVVKSISLIFVSLVRVCGMGNPQQRE